MRITYLFIFLVIFISGTTLKAQNCLENLYSANKLLDIGKTEECIALVTPCCHTANDESVRWQAFRLMSIAYLLKGNSDSSKIDEDFKLI